MHLCVSASIDEEKVRRHLPVSNEHIDNAIILSYSFFDQLFLDRRQFTHNIQIWNHSKMQFIFNHIFFHQRLRRNDLYSFFWTQKNAKTFYRRLSEKNQWFGESFTIIYKKKESEGKTGTKNEHPKWIISSIQHGSMWMLLNFFLWWSRLFVRSLSLWLLEFIFSFRYEKYLQHCHSTGCSNRV